MGQNKLYPIFLKMDNFQTLLVGGGSVGLEKLRFILKSSPSANVHIVSETISEEIKHLIIDFPQVTYQLKSFESQDIEGKSLVIAATSNSDINYHISRVCKRENILVNVADTPDWCDFYLGSIVSKGDLKIAISTNGKSPTFAKRFREMLEESLPDNIDSILSKLSAIRDELKIDFSQKVKKLDEITDVLTKKSK